MTTKQELKAIYDSRASFYNKAFVETNDNDDITLYSYNTAICTIKKNGKIVNLFFEDISMTTSRHIKEFFKQYCDMNAKKYKKLYVK